MKNKTKVTDRRTRYTRQTIKDSFLTLLEEKPFSKITVTEICAYQRSTGEPFIFIIMI